MLDRLLELRPDSILEWLVLLLVNVLLVWFLWVIRPKMIARRREMELDRAALNRRWNDYYGAIGGPAYISLGATVPKLLTIHAIIGFNCFALFQQIYYGVGCCSLAAITSVGLWLKRE